MKDYHIEYNEGMTIQELVEQINDKNDKLLNWFNDSMKYHVDGIRQYMNENFLTKQEFETYTEELGKNLNTRFYKVDDVTTKTGVLAADTANKLNELSAKFDELSTRLDKLISDLGKS